MFSEITTNKANNTYFTSSCITTLVMDGDPGGPQGLVKRRKQKKRKVATIPEKKDEGVLSIHSIGSIG